MTQIHCFYQDLFEHRRTRLLELVMETAAKGLREFMEGKLLSVKIYDGETRRSSFARVGYTTKC